MKYIAVLMLALMACTDEENTVRTLKAHGFTDIRTTGYAFGCSDNDTFATGFVAKNVQGATVEGTVCCGVLVKGCTVRF